VKLVSVRISSVEKRNVELVRAYFDSINHGREVIASRNDPARVRAHEDQVSSLLHEDFEMHFRTPQGNRESYVGADSFVDAGTAWLEPWREYRTQLDEAIAMEEHVIVVSRARAVPSEGGDPVERLVFFLWTFKDGRVIRMEHFRTKGEAVRAARSRD
jgi:ketosteroid isomerase-like protein